MLFSYLPILVLVLLAADFHRMGDSARADAFFALAQQQMPAVAVWAYVTRGEEGADFSMAEPRFRAALYLARALALEATGASGAALRARAEKADLPHGFISRAAARWAKGAAPAQPSDNDKPIIFVRTAR